MVKLFNQLPPAGTPITGSELFRIAKASLSGSADDIFERAIKAHTAACSCFLLSSGRASLAIALQALAQLYDGKKNEVVIPAYTCFTVPASAAKSHLKMRIVDIDPMTLDFDFRKLSEIDLSRTAAIVGCNLLGILDNWSKLRSIASANGAFLIDDAAQALGARSEFGIAGTMGDVGIFSFGRGKNLSLYSGGAIITSNERISSVISHMMAKIPRPSIFSELATLAKIVMYSVLINPRVYWLPASIPFLGLGKTIYDPGFDIGGLGVVRRHAGRILLDKLDSINMRRRENARKLAIIANEGDRFRIPGYCEPNIPAYRRLPVLCATKAIRDNAIRELQRNGISASSMYPSTVRQISGIEEHLASDEVDYPGAQTVVDRMLVLPTHPMLADSDIQKIIKCLRNIN